jgi:hypothetical protein
VTFPFEQRNGLVVVTAYITGPKGDGVAFLALDTGCACSMLSRTFLLSIGCELTNRSRRQIHTASGSEMVPSLVIQRIRALGKERSDLPILCHNLPGGLRVDGLLGVDFMRPYRLVVDFPKGTVVLR